MTKRKKMILGNWKMYKQQQNALHDFCAIQDGVLSSSTEIRVGVAAPYIHLSALSQRRKDNFMLLAQNVHWEHEGPFTGEISPSMLKDLQVSGSLIGHSERRSLFGESNSSTGKRLRGAIMCGLEAILCVGETLQERESGKLTETLREQLTTAFKESHLAACDFMGSHPDTPLLTIAYEPVWAIGTGKSATPLQAQEAHNAIRLLLHEFFSQSVASKIGVLYGGSVKSNNIKEFLSCEDIDGALVGGASLDPVEFLKLISNAAR